MAVTRRRFLAGAAAAPLLGMAAGPEPDLLTLGITGLARACDNPGWFQGHWGAAVLATHYLLKENEFEEPLRTDIVGQARTLIGIYADYFKPLEPQDPDGKLADTVARALEAPISGLRAHGHASIFATLGLRALKDAPHMATPRVAQGLVRLSERISKKKPLQDHDYNRKHPLPPYATPTAIAEATFDCLLRYERVRFAPFEGEGLRRPNFTHRLTYTDSLIQLERMGRRELAAKGYAAHQVYVNTAPPAGTARDVDPHPDAVLSKVLSPEYWEDEARRREWKADFDPRKNRMGRWIVGHLFKILYSYMRLRKLVKDREKVARVDRIILQRYVDRKASGG